MLRRGWNTKHHMVTTIRRTAAHLYHTVNHYRVHLPHGASITWCTNHTLHGSRFLNYHHTVHLPCGAWTQVPQLPNSAPTQALHAPTGWCTYLVVHGPRFLNYHTVRRPKHFMQLPHSAPTGNT